MIDFMTPADADQLYAWVQGLTLSQLLALWRWICCEIAGRIQRGDTCDH